MQADEERGLRADARINQDRILAAAARLFAEPDADTSFKAIAKAAGVGIGTLYRRFPTRADLIEATYRERTRQLANSTTELLAGNPPADALRHWMEDFVDYVIAKNGMSEALPAILADRDGLRADSRQALHSAVDTLLAAAAAEGTLRADIPAEDVLMSIGGVTLIAGHERSRALATRLIGLVMDGLRPVT